MLSKQIIFEKMNKSTYYIYVHYYYARLDLILWMMNDSDRWIYNEIQRRLNCTCKILDFNARQFYMYIWWEHCIYITCKNFTIAIVLSILSMRIFQKWILHIQRFLFCQRHISVLQLERFLCEYEKYAKLAKVEKFIIASTNCNLQDPWRDKNSTRELEEFVERARVRPVPRSASSKEDRESDGRKRTSRSTRRETDRSLTKSVGLMRKFSIQILHKKCKIWNVKREQNPFYTYLNALEWSTIS